MVGAQPEELSRICGGVVQPPARVAIERGHLLGARPCHERRLNRIALQAVDSAHPARADYHPAIPIERHVVRRILARFPQLVPHPVGADAIHGALDGAAIDPGGRRLRSRPGYVDDGDRGDFRGHRRDGRPAARGGRRRLVHRVGRRRRAARRTSVLGGRGTGAPGCRTAARGFPETANRGRRRACRPGRSSGRARACPCRRRDCQRHRKPASSRVSTWTCRTACPSRPA